MQDRAPRGEARRRGRASMGWFLGGVLHGGYSTTHTGRSRSDRERLLFSRGGEKQQGVAAPVQHAEITVKDRERPVIHAEINVICRVRAVIHVEIAVQDRERAVIHVKVAAMD